LLKRERKKGWYFLIFNSFTVVGNLANWHRPLVVEELLPQAAAEIRGWAVGRLDPGAGWQPPVPAFGRLIRKMVEPNRSWFPYLILLGEISVAIGLILGLFTPVALIVAIFLNLS
jgi:uncharacterized membrane protein YphA (DoxX/SURF4 family)